MLPRAAILALVAAVACALQITAAQKVHLEDQREPLKKYTEDRDIKFNEDFLPRKTGFTYDWVEDIILQEKTNLETTIKLQKIYRTGAVIRYFKTADTLFTLMYKRVKAARDFIEMANRDVFWYHAEKKLQTTRKKLDTAVKRCSGQEATTGLIKYINDLKHSARRCSLELVARAEVNEREFEFVARALNKIYWRVEGCIGDAVRIEKPVTRHIRKKRGFLKILKKMGKKFIEISLPFLAGTAAGDAMKYGLSWLNGDADKDQKVKPCIDDDVLDNTRINTQMLLYRAHDAIDLVNAAWLLENTTITTNNKKLLVTPMQLCVKDKVNKADVSKFHEVLDKCGVSEVSIHKDHDKDNKADGTQYSAEADDAEFQVEDEDEEPFRR